MPRAYRKILDGFDRNTLLSVDELRGRYDLKISVARLRQYMIVAYNHDDFLRNMMVCAKSNRGCDVYYVRAECAEQFIQGVGIDEKAQDTMPEVQALPPHDVAPVATAAQMKDVLDIVMDTIITNPALADKIINFCNKIKSVPENNNIASVAVNKDTLTARDLIKRFDIKKSFDIVKQSMAKFAYGPLAHALEYTTNGRGPKTWRIKSEFAERFVMAANLVKLPVKDEQWISVDELVDQNHVTNSVADTDEKLSAYFWDNPLSATLRYCATSKNDSQLCVNVTDMDKICKRVGLKRGTGIVVQDNSEWLTAAQLNDTNKIVENFATIADAMKRLSDTGWSPNHLQLRTATNGVKKLHLHNGAISEFCRAAKLTEIKPVETTLPDVITQSYVPSGTVYQEYNINCSYPDFVKILAECVDYGVATTQHPMRKNSIFHIHQDAIYNICVDNGIWSDVRGPNYLDAKDVKRKYGLYPSAEKINDLLADVYINDKMPPHAVDCRAGDVLCVHVNYALEFLKVAGLQSAKTRALAKGKKAVLALAQPKDIKGAIASINAPQATK